MKVWITKYALTTGIKEVESEVSDDGLVKAGWNYYIVYRDAYKSLAEANVKAEQMRRARIASLKKQLAALEVKRFE